jgi:hypothetical protein
VARPSTATVNARQRTGSATRNRIASRTDPDRAQTVPLLTLPPPADRDWTLTHTSTLWRRVTQMHEASQRDSNSPLLVELGQSPLLSSVQADYQHSTGALSAALSSQATTRQRTYSFSSAPPGRQPCKISTRRSGSKFCSNLLVALLPMLSTPQRTPAGRPGHLDLPASRNLRK